MKRSVLIVSKENFRNRTKIKRDCITMEAIHETNQSFECGCGEDHLICEDGVKVNRQIDDFEFVVSCANNFETLLENDLILRKQFSIVSADFSK